MLRLGNQREISRESLFWCRLVIVLAVAGLICSLATRTFRLSTEQHASVKSGAAQGMRQHLDRDATRWVPPTRTLVILEAPTFYPRVAPAGPPVRGLILEESLYNRPPPVLG